MADQVEQALAIAVQGSQPVGPDRFARDFAGDIRIAVPIAADPGSELEEQRNFEFDVRKTAFERALRLRQQLRHDVEQVLVEEIKPPGHLLRHRGLFQLQLSGEP